MDASTLLLADTEAGRGLGARLAALPQTAGCEQVFVPDSVCANVLLPSKCDVIMQVSCCKPHA